LTGPQRQTRRQYPAGLEKSSPIDPRHIRIIPTDTPAGST
jgi:hypothetical protein